MMTLSWSFLLAWASSALAGEVTLKANEVVVSPEGGHAEGDIELAWEGHWLTARGIKVSKAEDGTLTFAAEDFGWTPCECEDPPWSVSGHEAEGVLDEYLVMRKGVFRFCGVKVLPLPYLRIPLNDRAPRFHLPEFHFGSDGAVVGLPLWLPLGTKSHALLTSEVWSRRWLRQRVAVAGPVGHAEAAVAKDAPRGVTRGQVATTAGLDDGLLRIAVDGSWVSDGRVRHDYGHGYLERSTMFEERIAVVGVGPARLESVTFNEGLAGRPLAAVVSIGSAPLGPSSLAAYARVDTYTEGEVSRRYSAAGGTWSTGYRNPWLDIESVLSTRASQADDASPATRTGLDTAAMIPTWSQFRRGRALAQTGLAAWYERHEGTLQREDFGARFSRPRWGIGPTHRGRLLGSSGIPLRWTASAMWTPIGWRPEAEVNFSRETFTGTIHADRDIQAGTVAHATEGGHLRIGLMRDDSLFHGLAQGALLGATHWRPGWSGQYDLMLRRFVRQGPSLRWDSGCKCLSADASVEWAIDRAHPDVMFRLNLQERQPADR